MATTREYLFAIQDPSGREVCSARLRVERVSSVTATKNDDDIARILLDGEVIAQGHTEAAGDELGFHRWLATDKLADPVSHGVDRVQ